MRKLDYCLKAVILVLFLFCLNFGIGNSIVAKAADGSTTVYITEYGEKYHSSSCQYLHESKISISLSSAVKSGYSPCSVCNPPRFTSIFEIVKLYLGLKDNNVPVVLLNKDEIFAYLREEDYVGFVPETDIPVYCQLKFKHHKVDDFRHYNPEIHSKILNKIEWQEYDKIELIEETV